MDVELQILKHLARDAQPTVSFIDKYCVGYKVLFPEVRSYECFKYLHLGIISGIKRKLDVFPNHNLLLGFHELIHAMNQFQPFFLMERSHLLTHCLPL